MKEGWGIRNLGEVVEVLDNLRKPITKGDRVEGEYPYYGATGILSYVNNYIFSEKLVLIGEDGAKWLSGDNTSFIVEGKYWVNNHAHVIRPIRKIILDEWIVYFLNFSDLTPFITGMTVPKLNQEKMRSIPIPVPPLPEQQRIVSILDEAVTFIAKAKANAEQNLRNAKELFESYLQSAFKNKGDDWEEKKLGDLCDIKHGYAFEGNDFETDYLGDRPIVLTPGNFSENSTLIFNSKNTKRCNAHYPKEYKFEIGDLVVVMTDLSSKMKILGKPALIEEKNILHNQRIGRFVFSESSINIRYLFYFLQTNEYLTNIRGSATGTMVRHTAPKRILGIKVPLPTLQMQQTIVQNLDALSVETKKLEAICQQKISDLEELKKSILQKAFNGELKEKEMIAL